MKNSEEQEVIADGRRLWETFKERRMSLRTMDTPLRLATAGAIACLVGSVLVIALRDVGGSSVILGITGGVLTTLSTPLFVASLVFLAVGLGYVVTGVVLAHRATLRDGDASGAVGNFELCALPTPRLSQWSFFELGDEVGSSRFQ